MQLTADQISGGYHQKQVVSSVNLELRGGEFVGLIGPNGGGKSTLLRLLTRQLSLSHGSVHYDTDSLSDLSTLEIARRVAFVPQSEPTLFEFTVKQVVLMGRHPHVKGLFGERPEDYAIANQAMALSDVLHLAERPITSLSGGEHRRALLARGLAQSAPILFLDEPTTHLDVTHQLEIMRIVRKLADEKGTAVLAALHDLNLAAEFCDRLILLKEGRVICEGSPEQALTPETLETLYDMPVRVFSSPLTGRPMVLTPANRDVVGPGNGKTIHLVCGGGTGAAVMTSLLRHGFKVTSGVLNTGDSDADAAHALGVVPILEAPFSPISPSKRAELQLAIENAEAVVLSSIPFGNGNLVNLAVTLEAAQAGKPTYVLSGPDIASRDFTAGEASVLWRRLIEAGAKSVESPAQLVALLSNQH